MNYILIFSFVLKMVMVLIIYMCYYFFIFLLVCEFLQYRCEKFHPEFFQKIYLLLCFLEMLIPIVVLGIKLRIIIIFFLFKVCIRYEKNCSHVTVMQLLVCEK